ncbi:MAG: cation diffusion facilitator family transporter [Acidobacteriota bacterium]
MAHRHDHGGDGRRRAGRRLRLSLLLTLFLFVVEAVGGYLSGSLALLSDAGHMLSDAGALLVSFFALLIAQRPANPRKTYGYYRAEILAAVGNALALLLLTGFIVYEAIGRLLRPPEVSVVPMLAIAGAGLASNAASLLLLRSECANLNVRAAFLHVVGDLVSSVAVVLSGLLMLATGSYVLDPIASLCIALLIVIGALRILREAVDVLLEATPPGTNIVDVERALRSVEGISAVHDLHVWTITSGMDALSAHVIVKPERLADSHRILNDLKLVLLERFAIDHTTIQIEPEGFEHVGEVHAAHVAD